MASEAAKQAQVDVDVIVVGAGAGGLYAIHRLTEQGLRVRCIEGAGGVGGVWYHNRYPGARVDVDSLDYSYHFSDELLEKWNWTERFAAQPELLEYFEFVADLFDLNDKIVFNTWVTSAQWDPDAACYHVETSTGEHYISRFLVMTTGNLTVARKPAFKGIERFRGQWVQTSSWPLEEVPLRGRRIAVVGTGSSGMQVVPAIAGLAEHLIVFQRTPHYAVPAHNRPLTPEDNREGMTAREIQDLLYAAPGGTRFPIPDRIAADYTPAEQQARLQQYWDTGGQQMLFAFLDQSRNVAASEIVSEFIRDKVRAQIPDPELRESLVPTAYPFGVKRVALELGYYDAFGQENVTLVDLRRDPFVEITETGIRTESGEHEVDLIIFAVGFVAFTAAIDSANIRNVHGETPTQKWSRGPRTMLGLMTPGFPNLFVPTGAGSPSVIANLITQNEFAIDWIGDLIAFMDENGHRRVEPTDEAVEEWTNGCEEVSAQHIRRLVDNYQVKINDDGTRAFWPYAGGFNRYIDICRRIAAERYQEFSFN